jgi:hypothetical protein
LHFNAGHGIFNSPASNSATPATGKGLNQMAISAKQFRFTSSALNVDFRNDSKKFGGNAAKLALVTKHYNDSVVELLDSAVKLSADEVSSFFPLTPKAKKAVRQVVMG